MVNRKRIRFCMALNCRTSGLQDQKRLFRFPTNANQKKKWIENLGLENACFLSNSRSLVCQRHFMPQCFGKSKLFAWGLPTLHLGTGTDAKHHPVRPLFKRVCSVRNCDAQSPETLHTFPTHPELRAKWLELCGLTDRPKNYYICGRHFRPSFLLRKKLLRTAFPELNLGLEEYDPLKDSHNLDAEENETEGDSEENEAESDAEENEKEDDAEVDTNSKLASNRSISRAEEHEVEADINCNKCLTHDYRCQEMREQIDAMRKKITQLEGKLQLSGKTEEEEEEEYIWMLLN